MDLTPIRVRGRRKRNLPAAELDVSSSPTIARLRKIARFNHANPEALKKRPRKDPKLSDLEQLPTEIVQVIFDYSNNISLPMTSLVLSRLLSADHIYLRFATDLLYTGNDEESSNHDAAVSRMLQCKWMTWKMFKSAVQGCLVRAKRHAAMHQNEQTDDDDEEEDDSPSIPAPDFVDPEYQAQLPYLHLHAPIQLPEKVLRGPWSTDTTSFLYYLIWSNVGIDWNLSSRGEVATTGLQQAISERNRKAVACLVSPVVGVIPSAANLKAAVMDHGCEATIVFCLVQAALRAQISARLLSQGHALTDVSFKDPSLWSWAGRVKATGNGKGTWLVEVLRTAADFASRNSVYDGAVHEDFVRVCGKAEDGVERIEVPLRFGDAQEGGDGNGE